MSYNLEIPTGEDDMLRIELNDEQRTLFVLGANGTGKSALLLDLTKAFYRSAVRVSAHRQTWFEPSRVEMTRNVYLQHTKNMREEDRKNVSRYRDNYSTERPHLALFGLTKAQDDRAYSVTALVDEDKLDNAKTYAQDHQNPIDTINDIFQAAGFDIKIVIESKDRHS